MAIKVNKIKINKYIVISTSSQLLLNFPNKFFRINPDKNFRIRAPTAWE